MGVKRLVDIIYPRHCPVCMDILSDANQSICDTCLERLPRAEFEGGNSLIEEILVPLYGISSGIGLYFFRPENSIQRILHQIKYMNQPKCIKPLVNRSKKELRNLLKPIDTIVPVPMHKSKIRIRGYNQAKLIADEIGVQFSKPVYPLLERVKKNSSQTKRNRLNRWYRVQSDFRVNNSFNQPKHILLVDDVFTTGATTAACIERMQTAWPEVKISVCCLAITD